MFSVLPPNATTMLDWSWSQIEPYYNDLAARELNAGNVAPWLADWTRIAELVEEMYARLNVATTVNTADKESEERYRAFLDQIFPPALAAEQKLKEKLLASNLEPDGFTIPLRNMRTEAAIFRVQNLPLQADELKLSNEYDKIIGAQTVPWQGEEVTITQLRPVYLETDRAKRESAWRLAAHRQLADRATIIELWKKFLDRRIQMAANAGFADYRAYRWRQLLRFDYTPDDCRNFHRAIEQVVVPAALRVYARRRVRLGVATLRPWDLDVDPLGRATLRPYHDVASLKQQVKRTFDHLDATLGNYFDVMMREDLLDLENRKNKAPGGYCTAFAAAKRPFIFMNAVGLHDDVQTLLHESGHCFHVFESAGLLYAQQRNVGSEFAEVASMGMELLASSFLTTERGGFYSEQDAARARIEHLEKSILFWLYMAVVDAFQHWVYENPHDAMDPANCDAQWAMQWTRFMRGVDWSGLDEEMKTGWQRKLHIHQLPFYYIEYGLAQLGAVQVWANSLRDQAAAIANYRHALALGGTVTLPELYAAAGAKFAFDAKTLGNAVALMEKTIDDLEHDAG
ncbi:MAG: M3 family oligoendopeptidase [Chloroflexi bacterium]|nr:M3 family oligoendopeptidase [Chloroflexota bacterium]